MREASNASKLKATLRKSYGAVKVKLQRSPTRWQALAGTASARLKGLAKAREREGNAKAKLT